MAEFDLEEIMEKHRRKWNMHRECVQQYRPPSYKCQHCKDSGFLDLYPQNPRRSAGGEISTMMYCPYCRADKLRDISGIIAEYRELDIGKFTWEAYQDIALAAKLKQTVESFVYDFQQWRDEGIGLYIYSGVKGSGKTMIANAICGSVCTRYNIAARFIKVEDLLENVKKSYGSRGRDEFSRGDFWKYYETDLLVVDDLCVSKINDWGQGVLHDLINERYKAKRLCIFTSNYRLEELPVLPATSDRINDMCIAMHFPEEPVRARRAEERKSRLVLDIRNRDRFVDADGGTPFEGGRHK